VDECIHVVHGAVPPEQENEGTFNYVILKDWNQVEDIVCGQTSHRTNSFGKLVVEGRQAWKQ
jgi:hypothetical protein